MFRPFSRRLLEGVVDAPATPEPQPQAPTEEPENPEGKKLTAEDHMRREINKLRKQLSQRDAADAEREAAAKKAAEEERQKKLAAEGDYKTALAEKDAQIEKINADFAAKEREWKLRAGLAGMNDLALAGAIAGLKPDDDIDAYIKKIREKHEDLFDSSAPRATAQGKPSSKEPSKSLKDRLADGDQEAMRDTFNKLMNGESVNLT